jgi:PleD family two-component response regulator
VQAAICDLQIPHIKSPINGCVTLSIGVASLLPDLAISPDTLLDDADRLLYLAKQQGRNRVFFELGASSDQRELMA